MAKRDRAENMVHAAVAPLLSEIGFKKRKIGIFTFELADGVMGWLGLNQAVAHTPERTVEINPVVGVRHQQVERIVAELRGEKFHEYLPPTIRTSIGYILPVPEYRAWYFTAQNAPAVASDLAQTVEEYGLPFMRSHISLESLLKALQPLSITAIEDYAVYRRPAAWLLLGDPARARADLEKSLEALGAREDGAAVEFRRFAAAFRQRLGS